MGTRSYYIYILASRIGGTLYIGVTNDLIRRIGEHKSKAAQEMATSLEDFADRETKSGLD